MSVFHRDGRITVDEPEPLLNYLRSLLHVPEPIDYALRVRLESWEESVRAAFDAGPVRIQQRSGAFIAF